MRALHADAFRELPDFAATQHELLLQVSPLELLASLAESHGGREDEVSAAHGKLVKRLVRGKILNECVRPDGMRCGGRPMTYPVGSTSTVWKPMEENARGSCSYSNDPVKDPEASVRLSWER